MSNAPRNDLRRRRREASSRAWGVRRRANGRPRSLHKCIRREFCNWHIHRPGYLFPFAPGRVALCTALIRAYVKALLTVRAQCTTATCRSNVSARTRLAGRYLACVHAPDLPASATKGVQGNTPVTFSIISYATRRAALESCRLSKCDSADSASILLICMTPFSSSSRFPSVIYLRTFLDELPIRIY